MRAGRGNPAFLALAVAASLCVLLRVAAFVFPRRTKTFDLRFVFKPRDLENAVARAMYNGVKV